MKIPCHFTVPEIFIPEQTISNEDLVAMVDTSDQWIVERTGIRLRHKLGKNQQASDLGLQAAKKALEAAKISAGQITHVIAATCTPDYLTPSIACIIAGQLHCGQVMAFDIGAACAGFIYGLYVCKSFLAADADAKILFICSEAMTRRINWKDRGTCVLFGDAAAACVVTASALAHSCSLQDVICASDGSLKDLITVGGGTRCDYQNGTCVQDDFFISMQGRDTYRQAVRQMVSVCEAILKRNRLDVNDLTMLIPHQANIRIIEAVGSRLKIDADKVFTNLANYGNTSSASIPLALHEACGQGLVKKGGKVLVTAFGAGLTWGAALLEFDQKIA